MSTPSDSGTHLPLRPARRVDTDDGMMSPKSGPTKVVSIAEPEESPLLPPEESTRIKQFPASVSARRLTGRPVMPSNSSSRLSLVSQGSIEDYSLSTDTPTSSIFKGESRPEHHHKSREHHVHQHDRLLLQVSEWLQREKAKRAARKSEKRTKHHESSSKKEDGGASTSSRPRGSSSSSGSSEISLELLQQILEGNMGGFGHETLPSTSPYLGPRRPSHLGNKRRPSTKRALSSDTEYQDGDVVVPSCDVVLDNSKTMSYTGGAADSSDTTVTLSTSKRAEKERKPWLIFKGEIVKLAHTLRLKGWRRVPLENGGDIEVERLSGALTNAVYVVSPPKQLPPSSEHAGKYKPPPKLLLRIYGPQVEHLIDRESELAILRRLARKKIGPRLLGTFTNGRFEEFFNAQTLTADDLRIPDTSKQIAKRMRELHDGIDLLERERDEGAFVWQNWDKWVGRCSEVIEYLDKEILSGKKGREPWRSRGLVCGVEWNVFKTTIDRYRKWLEEYYKGKGGVKRNLVFAHNDTQYGNILRLVPEPHTRDQTPSPLLLPQNTHKQLVVIDFEYASANTPGLEFANHFTEWCYNYHNATKPWACNTSNYPTPDEQRRFIRSYLNHRPQFNPRASATPKMNAMDGLAKGSISEFLLDSRTPGGSTVNMGEYAEDEARRERETEQRVDEMMKEIRIWRVANSAQWVAWGIVQAKVPELDEATTPNAEKENGIEAREICGDVKAPENKPSEVREVCGDLKAPVETAREVCGDAKAPVKISEDIKSPDKRPEGLKAEALLQGDNPKEAEQLEDEEDAFDYLGYAQERALFFWGDVVSLGLVKKEELPEALVGRLKIVDY